MSSQPTPRTPDRRRPPDLSTTSPPSAGLHSNGSSPLQQLSHSRRSSLQSQYTPRIDRSSFSPGLGLPQSVSESTDLAGMVGESNGLGSLADELADAWDEDEEEYDGEESSALGTQLDGSQEGETPAPDDVVKSSEKTRDSGIDVASPLVHREDGEDPFGPSNGLPTGRTRRRESHINGTEASEASDRSSTGISPGLEAQMLAIERLAKPGMDSDSDDVVERLSQGLKDLGRQVSVESGATRLITAHTALATHLAYQTRALHSLTFPLLSPLSAPPDPAVIDSLLPLLASASELIPQPTSSALASLTQLSNLTAELIGTLNYLSDSLHMSRQTTTTATRRLRGARDLVAEIRRENELAEEGIRWIERGDWQARLDRRECGGVCRDVVGGFEEVCQGWRERLVAGAGVEAA